MAEKVPTARLVKARIKPFDQFPEVEKCCQEAIAMQQAIAGREMLIDMNQICHGYWESTLGHCGQQVPYRSAVMMIDEKDGRVGWFPFELLDIDEGPTD